MDFPDIPEVDVVAKKIGVKVKEWPGNCHTIAALLISTGIVPDAKLRYGHYQGPIAPGTMFSGAGAAGFVHHGWAELTTSEYKLIIDPTRWVFEAAEPYIYQAPDFEGYYDIGGNALRMGLMLGRPLPENDGTGDQYEVPDEGMAGIVIRQLLKDYDGPTVNFDQLGYIANQPLQFFAGEEKEIFSWLGSIGQRVLVPLDNWELVMEG